MVYRYNNADPKLLRRIDTSELPSLEEVLARRQELDKVLKEGDPLQTIATFNELVHLGSIEARLTRGKKNSSEA